VIPETRDKTILLSFFVFKPGKIKNIYGIEEAELIPDVIKLHLMVKPGQNLISPQSGAGRHGFMILKGRNYEEVSQIQKKIHSLIRIQYYD